MGNINQTKIANLFKIFYKNSEITKKFITISLASFVAYSSSIFVAFSILPRIDQFEINLGFFLFILWTLVSYYLFKPIIHRIVSNKENKLLSYSLLSLVLITGLIITFLATSYLINIGLHSSMADTGDYMGGYDLKAKEVNRVFLPLSLVIGLIIFFTSSVFSYLKQGLKLYKVILFGLMQLFLVVLIFSLSFAITSFLGIFILSNMGYPG
jgi:hypothetical protein